MEQIPDGAYDVVVTDAESTIGTNVARLDVAIVGGAHKGDVVSIMVPDRDGKASLLLGLPGCLTVTEGQSSLSLD